MRSDIALDSCLDAIGQLRRWLVNPPPQTGQGIDPRRLYPTFLTFLKHATPVYWSSSAFDQALHVAKSFDAWAPGSSFPPSDLVGPAEWWYFDDATLAAGPAAGPAHAVRAHAFLVINLDTYGLLRQDERHIDLGVVPFGRDVGTAPITRSPLPLGLYGWNSHEPCGTGWVLASMNPDIRDKLVPFYGAMTNPLMHWRQSKLAARAQDAPSRGARRRAAALDHLGPLIITLRAHESAPALTHTEREYAWSFWVRGHTRHFQDGTTTPVRTHLKGDKDKPLLVHPDTRVEVIR